MRHPGLSTTDQLAHAQHVGRYHHTISVAWAPDGEMVLLFVHASLPEWLTGWTVDVKSTIPRYMIDSIRFDSIRIDLTRIRFWGLSLVCFAAVRPYACMIQERTYFWFPPTQPPMHPTFAPTTSVWVLRVPMCVRTCVSVVSLPHTTTRTNLLVTENGFGLADLGIPLAQF